jgi:hypothetical protein
MRTFIIFIKIKMSFFTRCFTKKSPTNSPTESPIRQNELESRRIKEEIKEAENRERLYNELHFSSGMDLPIHPKSIHPSTILDKKLVIGQFGEPQKAPKLVGTVHGAQDTPKS